MKGLPSGITKFEDKGKQCKIWKGNKEKLWFVSLSNVNVNVSVNVLEDTKMKKATIVLMMAVLAAAVQASVISWAYDNGNYVLGTAGVVPAVNWNVTRPENTGGSSLNYSDGTASGVMLSVAGGFGAWGIGGVSGADADGTYNKSIFDGYYNSIGSTLTLSGISYAEYNIIVYFSSDGDGRTGTVSDGTTTYSFSTIMRNQVDNDPVVTFIQTIDTVGGNPGANYAVFSGLSGASQTFTIANASDGMGFAGIQIVAIPEPATMLLVGLGGLVLRKRK